MFSLCLPSSAHLSASSFRGSPRCAFILMKIVRRPSERRVTGFLSYVLLASSNARQVAPNSALLDLVGSSNLCVRPV